MMTPGKKIRYMRQLRGMSQKDLGELAGLDQTVISKIELGEIDNPRMLRVCRLALGMAEEEQAEHILTIPYRTAKYAYPPDRVKVGHILRACKNEYIPRLGVSDIDTGVVLDIPKGYTGFVSLCEGLLIPKYILPLGVVQSGPAQPVRVKLVNLGPVSYDVMPGDMIGCLYILPTPEVDMREKRKEREIDQL